MKMALAVVSMFLACGSLSVWTDERPGQAGFLFAYYPKKRMETDFDRGYRQHLEWHRERKDPLIWYAWTVKTGDRAGMFVDGTFGLTFADFDRRIAPEEDAADFLRTVAPYGDAAYRKVLRAKPELSTVSPLEERSPPANIEVLTHAVVKGREKEFEAAVARIVEASVGGEALGFTVYQQLSGGEQPAYIVMIPRENYAFFASDKAVISLAGLVELKLDGELREQTLDALSRSIGKVHSESWSYREALSYFPED